MCLEWLKLNQSQGKAQQDTAGLQLQYDLLGGTPQVVRQPQQGSLQPDLDPPDKDEAIEERPAPALVRVLTDEEIASFKALNAEVEIVSESLGALWLVSEYTDKDRQEISVEHAATLAAVCAAFPGAKVTEYRRPITAKHPNHEEEL